MIEKVLAKIMRHLPITVTSAIGAHLGRRKMQLARQKNLQWVARFDHNIEVLCGFKQPAKKTQKLLDFGEEFGRLYAETTVLHKVKKQQNITIKGREHLIDRTQPTIFIAPHISNWEIILDLFTQLEQPTCVLYEPRENKSRMQIVNQARQGWGSNIQLVSTASAMPVKTLKTALYKQNNIFILPDEEKAGYVYCPSLGRSVPYAGNRWMVSRLAISHQLDIIPVWVERVNKTQFVIHVEKKLTATSNNSPHKKAQILADQIDQLFNKLVKSQPQLWYWLPYLKLNDQVAPPPAHKNMSHHCDETK